MSAERECEHGQLRRSCDRCEMQGEIERLRAENERINACLRYEQHREGRVGTHQDGCEAWGPKHYECAEREIERLRGEVGRLTRGLHKSNSGMEEYETKFYLTQDRAEKAESELAELRATIDSAPIAIMDTHIALGLCAPAEEDFPALYALQGKRVRLVVETEPHA